MGKLPHLHPRLSYCDVRLTHPSMYLSLVRRRKVLYSGSWITWLCAKSNMRLKGRRITVLEAPEPSTILWENYGYRRYVSQDFQAYRNVNDAHREFENVHEESSILCSSCVHRPHFEYVHCKTADALAQPRGKSNLKATVGSWPVCVATALRCAPTGQASTRSGSDFNM